MSLSNFPAIGDIVLDPSEKFKDENQEGKYDLLLCDGSEVDEVTHPVLWGKLGGTEGDPHWNAVLSLHDPSSYTSGGWSSVKGGWTISLAGSGGSAFQKRVDSVYGHSITVSGGPHARAESGSNQELTNTDTTIEVYVTLNVLDATQLIWEEDSRGLRIRVTAAGNVLLQYGNAVLATTPVGIQVAELHVYTLVYSKGTNTAKLYVDGNYIGEGSPTNTFYNKMVIGNGGDGAGGVVHDTTYHQIRVTTAARYQGNHTPELGRFKGAAVVPNLPNMTSPDPSIPYRIIGDLT